MINRKSYPKSKGARKSQKAPVVELSIYDRITWLAEILLKCILIAKGALYLAQAF
jgi:hypothetical protein